MGLRDIKVTPASSPEVYQAVKDMLDGEVTYYHEDEEGLHVMLSDDEHGMFGNEVRRLCDTIDGAGGNTSKYRQKNGW